MGLEQIEIPYLDTRGMGIIWADFFDTYGIKYNRVKLYKNLIGIAKFDYFKDLQNKVVKITKYPKEEKMSDRKNIDYDEWEKEYYAQWHSM